MVVEVLKLYDRQLSLKMTLVLSSAAMKSGYMMKQYEVRVELIYRSCLDFGNIEKLEESTGCWRHQRQEVEKLLVLNCIFTGIKSESHGCFTVST